MVTKLPHLSDDHHFALANVAAQSAELDIVLDSAVYLTIEPPEVSLFLVKSLAPDRLVEILRLALVAELAEYEPKINSLFQRVKTMREARNQVLHWLHEPTQSREIVRFSDKRRGRDKTPKDLTARDIQKIADGIRDCYSEILEWWNLYNWHHEVRLHGKPKHLAHPPNWALPKKLRPIDEPKPKKRGLPPRKQ
jgi:hypothetical protein